MTIPPFRRRAGATASKADAALLSSKEPTMRNGRVRNLQGSRLGPGPQPLAGDETHAPLHGQIRPRPLGHHCDPAAKTDQPEDVYGHPEKPSDEPGEFQGADIRNGGAATNGRHVPIISITERLQRLAANGAEHIFGRMSTA